MKIKNILRLVLYISVVGSFYNDASLAMQGSLRQQQPTENNYTAPLSRSISQRPSPVYSPPTQSESGFEPKPRSVSRPSQPSTPSPFIPVRSEPTVEVKPDPVRAPYESTSRPTATVQPSSHSTTKAPYVPESTPFSSLDMLAIPEDDQVRRAMSVFLDEKADINMLPNSFRKGFEARDATSYFLDEETKRFSFHEKLAGCLAHLIAHGKTSSLRELFDNPNWKLWVYLSRQIGIETTCLDVVTLLSDTKQLLSDVQHNRQLSSLAESFINTALTKIFCGCWGISNKPTEPDVIKKLKGIARTIGTGRDTSLYATTNQIIGSYDQYNPKPVKDSLQEHYLVVANEIAGGSIHTQQVKNRLIPMFSSRNFSQGLITRIIGPVDGAGPFPKTPISGVMLSILTDGQFRKNIEAEKLSPTFQSYIDGKYSRSELFRLYNFISYSGFNFKKEKELLEGQGVPLPIPNLPLHMKIWLMLEKDTKNHSIIDNISEQNIQDQIRSNYPFQNVTMKESIERPDLPTWLRLILLKNSRGMTVQEASIKALEIMQGSGAAARGWNRFQDQTFGNDFMRIVTLYDQICQVSKPCSDADFESHRAFLDICVARARSSDLSFEAKRDVFVWLRGLRAPRESNLKIKAYQTDVVLGSIKEWVEEATMTDDQKDLFEKSQTAWFFIKGLKCPAFCPELLKHFEDLKGLIDSRISYVEFNRMNEDDRDQILFIDRTKRSLFDKGLLKTNLLGAIEDCGWKKRYQKIAAKVHPDKHGNSAKSVKIFQALHALKSFVDSIYGINNTLFDMTIETCKRNLPQMLS